MCSLVCSEKRESSSEIVGWQWFKKTPHKFAFVLNLHKLPEEHISWSFVWSQSFNIEKRPLEGKISHLSQVPNLFS